jgi:hypothetical protein
MLPDPHRPQRATDFFGMLMKPTVSQRCAPGTENRWRAGNALGLIFKQVTQA